MNDKPTILVTGSDGQVGSELRALSAAYPSYSFVFFNREDLDISDQSAIDACFEKHRPNFVINCAAYTAVDKAEEEQAKASAINAEAVKLLAIACKKFDAKLVHISTDYVFPGTSDQPYKETDAIDPVNFYGATKAEGERLAMETNPQTVIIRTSWVYSYFGKNFVKTMIRLMMERDQISVVNDQWGAPTYAADLAEVVMKMIDSGQWESGIYHFSNEGKITWFDFAIAIRNLSGASCDVQPIATKDYPTPAKRPSYSVMDLSKIVNTYQVELKPWLLSLEQCINRLKANQSFH